MLPDGCGGTWCGHRQQPWSARTIGTGINLFDPEAVIRGRDENVLCPKPHAVASDIRLANAKTTWYGQIQSETIR